MILNRLLVPLLALALYCVPTALPAADTATACLVLTKPEVGASEDSWGDKVDTNYDLLDAEYAPTALGDASLSATSTSRLIRLTTAFTTGRTITLPAASAITCGRAIIVADIAGAVTSTNTLTFARAGADTINGGTSFVVSQANQITVLRSDGTSKWIASSPQAADLDLAALAGLTSAADKVPYFTGSGTAAVADFTSTARTLVDDASTSAMRTTLGVVPGTDVQTQDADLSALAANSTDGLWAHTGSGTGAARTLTAPAAGITISNPAGIAGNPTFALANDLAALEALTGSDVLPRRTGTSTWDTIPYVEGTWTPVVSFTTPGSSSFTYATQTGKYTRIGNRVNFTIAMAFTPTKGTAAGSLQITLPISPAGSDEGDGGWCALYGTGWAWPAGRTSVSLLIHGSQLNIIASGSAVIYAAFAVANLTDAVQQEIYCGGSYRV